MTWRTSSLSTTSKDGVGFAALCCPPTIGMQAGWLRPRLATRAWCWPLMITTNVFAAAAARACHEFETYGFLVFASLSNCSSSCLEAVRGFSSYASESFSKLSWPTIVLDHSSSSRLRFRVSSQRVISVLFRSQPDHVQTEAWPNCEEGWSV